MDVKTEDIWVMLLSTIRYSMGRRSYIVGLCGALYDRYQDALTVQQRAQIAIEIEKELELSEKLGKTLGDRMDHGTWKEMAQKIRKGVPKGSTLAEWQKAHFQPEIDETGRTLDELFDSGLAMEEDA